MALFTDQPAGVQIKKWLIILVSLIVMINVLAVASLGVLQQSVTDIRSRYQPILVTAAEISGTAHQAQASLYKYLGEYQVTTKEVQQHTASMERLLTQAANQKGGREWESDLISIRELLARYRVIIRNLPTIGEETNWAEVEDFRTQAVIFGHAMEARASQLKAQASSRIGEKAARALNLSTVALAVFVGSLGLSIIIASLLLVWWRQFQEMILNL